MIHITTRDNLIEWLENNLPRPAIRRALFTGTTEVLGGFCPIPPTLWPGWIVRITALNKREWIVAVIAKAQPEHPYEIRVLPRIPWEHWIGKNSKNPLYWGDH